MKINGICCALFCMLAFDMAALGEHGQSNSLFIDRLLTRSFGQCDSSIFLVISKEKQLLAIGRLIRKEGSMGKWRSAKSRYFITEEIPRDSSIASSLDSVCVSIWIDSMSTMRCVNCLDLQNQEVQLMKTAIEAYRPVK
jgi:hypothetical protein